MAKWVWILLTCSMFLITELSASAAHADCVSDAVSAAQSAGGMSTTNAITFCGCLRTAAPDKFAGPLVQCFTDPAAGIIPVATGAFLNHAQGFYLGIVEIFLTFVVALFGVKLILGDVQRIKATTLTLALKIGGIVFFLTQAPTFYMYILIILKGLSDSISDAATQINSSGFYNLVCNTADTGTASFRLWDRWDCFFDIILIWSGTIGIGAMLLMLFFTAGTGVIIVFVAIYFIIALVFAATRFIHMYLMSVLALSFLFTLGYIFVPLMVFRNTFDYFQKWLNIVFAYVLLPIITLGYMGMMLVALDVAVFSGQYSIWSQITGSTTYNASNSAFSVGVNNNIASYKGGAHVALGNTTNDTQGNCTSTATPGGPAVASTNGGALGTVRNENVKASCFENSAHPTMTSFGIKVMALDVATIASNMGESAATWLVNVLLAFCTAALLAYVMYKTLSYIPDLASDLVSPGARGSMQGVTKSAQFGEALVKNTVEAVKNLAIEAAEAYATGGASLAKVGGKMALSMAKKQASDMMSKRR